MTTHYQSSSKGAVLISSMPHAHLMNAYDKLVAAGDPERAAEVAAMAAQIAANEADFAEEQASTGEVA